LGEEVLRNLFTFGISMDSCSLPGKSKSHSLNDDEIEIGMGIHGEPGKEKVKWKKSRLIINELL
jgi:dihydroxyacetone kinase-like protein